MFELGASELFLIAIITVVVLGPKHIPEVVRTISGVMRRMRGLAREFQSGLDDLAREADLNKLQDDLRRAAQIEPAGSGAGGKSWLDKALDLDEEDADAGLTAEQITVSGTGPPAPQPAAPSLAKPAPDPAPASAAPVAPPAAAAAASPPTRPDAA